MTLKLGIDVGSTHTDAVILSARNEFVGAVKTPTTPDVTTGVVNGLDAALQKTGADPSEGKLAAIGTTHCLNAIVERRRLAQAAAIRISLPAGGRVEARMDWPADRQRSAGGP